MDEALVFEFFVASQGGKHPQLDPMLSHESFFKGENKNFTAKPGITAILLKEVFL